MSVIVTIDHQVGAWTFASGHNFHTILTLESFKDWIRNRELVLESSVSFKVNSTKRI